MIYYAFEPARLQGQKKAVQIMYPDATIIDRCPNDEWFLYTLSEQDTLIINDIYDLCGYTNPDIQKYMSLYLKNINILFEKSTGCDSNHIKKIIGFSNLPVEVLVKIEIEAYKRRCEYDIQQKRSSMAAAKLRGKRIGGKEGVKLITKKSIEVKQKIFELSKDFNGTLSDIELLELTDISRNTYYRYKRNLREEVNNNLD